MRGGEGKRERGRESERETGGGERAFRARKRERGGMEGERRA
jgi:hypothetical protein